jgi:hypothetical protein
MMAYIKTGVAKITEDGDVLNITVLSQNKDPQSIIPLMEEYSSENRQEIDMERLAQQQELIDAKDNMYAVSWDSGKKTDFKDIESLKKFIEN